MTVSDFDDDGYLDIYVGFPGARDFTSLAFSPDPLQTQGLFRNTGALAFADHTLAAGLGPKDADGNRRAWPHAAVDADFDGDGDVDLIVADDRQGPTTVLRNGGACLPARHRPRRGQLRLGHGRLRRLRRLLGLIPTSTCWPPSASRPRPAHGPPREPPLPNTGDGGEM